MTAGTVLNTYTPELRNLIINGNMDFWQRGTSSSSLGYLADRFKTTGSGAYVATFAQSSDVPTQSQSGWQSLYSFQTNVTTGASIGAGDFLQIIHILEGQDYQQIHSKKVRFQFWCKCSVAGTYAVAFRNNGQTRSYVTTFTVNSTNTWEKKTIDVTLDSSGTWNFDNTQGLQINIGLTCGTTFATSTLNAWQSGNFVGATGQTQLANTTGATFQLAQVALYAVPASSGTDFPFVRAGRSVGHELQLCQRYYEKSIDVTATSFATSGSNYLAASAAAAGASVKFSTTKRIAPTGGSGSSPTVRVYSENSATIDNVRDESSVADRAVTYHSANTTGFTFTIPTIADGAFFGFNWFCDCEL